MSEYLPENSLFAWEVDDWPSFKEDFSASPWGEVADFPAWSKIRELIEEKWEEKLSPKGERNAEDYYREVHSPIVESMNGGLTMAVGQIEKSFTLEVLKWENENGGKSRWKAARLPNITFLAESSLSDREFEEIIDWISARIKSSKMDHAMMEKSLIAGVDIHWLGHAKSEELTKMQARDTMVAFAFHKGAKRRKHENAHLQEQTACQTRRSCVERGLPTRSCHFVSQMPRCTVIAIPFL